jgi:CTP:molybdopterin cytidylyltransferase MocA
MLVALILAAGEGSRLGAPKANVDLNGERLVDRAVSIFTKGGCAKIYVVLGAWVGPVSGAEVIINTNWRDGMGSSLRAGLTHITSHSQVNSVLISLVDLPGLTPEAVEQIIKAPGEIVVSTFRGIQGHPVKFSRNHWPAVIDGALGEVGARAYLATRSDIQYVKLDEFANGKDVDTPADLAFFTHE